jgi:hypothetical protein
VYVDKHTGTMSTNNVVYDENSIHISIDLVDASRRELSFLEEVDSHQCLYSDSCVKNAIRRYEQCWLPLVAEHDGKEIAPPLDVHWIWHVHMLAPYYYEKDCQKLVNKPIDHRLMSENTRHAAVERTKQLWLVRYKNEPFEPYLDPAIDGNTCNGFHSGEEYQPKCSYDLEGAVSRQRVFYYQVSLPHYRDSSFLRSAVLRYKKYLFLKKTNPDMFLVPCYDFDLVWHAHQLHPLIYKQDTTCILGRMFNHDDSVNDRSADSKLIRSDAKTREMWKETFKEEFSLSGAMYRGDPPIGKLNKVTSEQIYAVSSKTAEVVISNIKLENFAKEKEDSSKFTLKVALSGKEEPAETVLKLKGPQRVWENNGKGVTKFLFDTGTHNQLQLDLVDKKGFLCFGSAHSYSGNYQLRQVIESTPVAGQTITQSLPLGAENGIRVGFTACVNPPQKGPCILILQAGPFQSYTMPENIEQLWGPITLPRLPEGIPNTCIVASHRLESHV